MPRTKEAEADKKYEMSDEHKERLAVGREQSRVVRSYLQALQEHRPKRGRKVTPESLEKRLISVNEQIDLEDDPLRRLELISEREQLEHRLQQVGGGFDLSELEAEFVKVASEYGQRRGITYTAWREIGVAPSTLRQAGIRRTV